MNKEVEVRCKKELKGIKDNMDKLEKQVKEVVGVNSFDIKSADALKDLVFVRIKYPVLERLNDGPPSISKQTILKIVAMMCKDGETQKFPVVSLILEYKKQYKALYDM